MLVRNNIKQKGFTIVELLIVIVVIGILAAITIVAYNGISNRAKDSAADAGATQASKKLVAYAAQNNDQMPVDLATAGVVDDTTTYQYMRNTVTNPQTYCVTATNGGYSVHIATAGKPTPGPCNGHTGTAPTTLADGSSCPAGYVLVPGASLFGTQAFCAMKYEAKNDGSGNAVSVAIGTPWTSISQTTAISTAAATCSSCHLMTDAEWLTLAQNIINVGSNWSGGTVGSGYVYSGHNDASPASLLAASTDDNDPYNGTGNSSGDVTVTAGMIGRSERRTFTLSNGAVIWDLSGNANEWTSGTISGGGLPGLAADTSTYNGRQWNNALLLLNALPPSNLPSYATAAASAWNTNQRIGLVNTSYVEPLARSFIRGGNHSGGDNDGLYYLTLNLSAVNSSATVGFRVVR